MEIVIIGTGNTATVLGKKLKTAGHRIVQVFGRNAKSASQLAYALYTEFTNYWSNINPNADLYVVAVSDNAIEEVVKHVDFKNKTVVHTAGSVSKEILRGAKHYGVFYPLQSLNKSADSLPDIPIIIDAESDQTLLFLQELAFSISATVWQASDEKRKKLHLAAVFCNNFTNHLYTLAAQYCTAENLDFTLLIPLIKQTADRLQHLSPQEAQTGPAARNDGQTIEKHLQLLSHHPQLAQFYQMFTQSIIAEGNKGF